MKKIIKQVSDNIIQITTTDERWYVKEVKNKKGEVIDNLFVPSVTWIAGHYPKGIGFYKWLAEHGWNEAETIKNAAGDKGSKVHNAIVDLIDGKEVKMDDQYINNTTGQPEELSLEEYECLMSFKNWFDEVKPKVILKETVVFNKQYGYAGTVDLVCKIGKELYIIDFKTSQYIWPESELQLSAYKHASKKNVKLAILQLGYRRNKNKFKFTEIEDKFNLFLAARQIWQEENSKVVPLQKDYPISLLLNTADAKPKKNAVHNKQVVKKVSQHPIRR